MGARAGEGLGRDLRRAREQWKEAERLTDGDLDPGGLTDIFCPVSRATRGKAECKGANPEPHRDLRPGRRRSTVQLFGALRTNRRETAATLLPKERQSRWRQERRCPRRPPVEATLPAHSTLTCVVSGLAKSKRSDSCGTAAGLRRAEDVQGFVPTGTRSLVHAARGHPGGVSSARKRQGASPGLSRRKVARRRCSGKRVRTHSGYALTQPAPRPHDLPVQRAIPP